MVGFELLEHTPASSNLDNVTQDNIFVDSRSITRIANSRISSPFFLSGHNRATCTRALDFHISKRWR